MNNTERALDLIIMADQDMGGQHDDCEIAHLREEAKKGFFKFCKACRLIFGTRLSGILYGALRSTQEATRHAYCFMTDELNEEEACAAILLARDRALGCKLILQMQRKLECDEISQAERLSSSVDYYAQAIRLKLDPQGILCPEAVDSQSRHINEIIFKPDISIKR